MHPVPLSTPVGMLKALSHPSSFGPLVLSASFSSSPSSDVTPVSADTVLADTKYPSVTPTLIAEIPGLDIDPDTAVLCGNPFDDSGTSSEATCAVTVLTKCLSAIVTLYDRQVAQILGLRGVPPGVGGGRVGVSTQGGTHHLLSVQPSTATGTEGGIAPLAKLYVIDMEGGDAAWVECGVDVADSARDVLQSCLDGSVTKGVDTLRVICGRHTGDGSLVVAVGVGGRVTHMLRLDTTPPTPVLSLCCQLDTPVTCLPATRLSSCGDTAILSHDPKDVSSDAGTSATCISLSTGGVYPSMVSGESQVSCPVGTLYSQDRGHYRVLDIAVRDWMCVPLQEVIHYSVHGQTLVYTDKDSALHAMDLTTLVDYPLLPAVKTASQAGSIPWLSKGDDKWSFEPTLTGRVGRKVIAVALSGDCRHVVGVAECDLPTLSWSTMLQPKQDVETRPFVSDRAIAFGTPVAHTMYAAVDGLLLSVPLINTAGTPLETTFHPITLSRQPQFDRDSTYMVLPTATGLRRQRVAAPLPQVGGLPVVSTGCGGSVLGQCVGAACVSGVVCGEDVCFSVKRGVWSPMKTTDVGFPRKRGGAHLDGHGAKRKRPDSCTRTDNGTLTSKDAVMSAISRGSSQVVRGVILSDSLAGRRLEQWAFEQCSFTSLTGASLSHCTFSGCNLSVCDLNEARLLSCTFTECAFSGVASCFSIVNSDFVDCDTSGMVLEGCTISGKNSGLPCVDMTNRHITEKELEGEDVSRWDMAGARLADCNLATVGGITVEQIGSLSALTGCSLRNMDLMGLDISKSDVTGSDLSGANLTRCDVTDAVIVNCDLSDCSLVGVRGLTEVQLKSARSVRGATISGVDMRGWSLTGVDLCGTDLRSCNMAGTIVGEGCIEGAQLPCDEGAPTVQTASVRFEVGPGVTETQVDLNGMGDPDDLDSGYSVTLIVPAGDLTWKLAGDCYLYAEKNDDPLMYHETDDSVSCSRVGNKVEFEGDVTATLHVHECHPEKEARIELEVYRGEDGGHFLTLVK
ncbi:hypothetical protein KIPB_000208 [Kipferlia bialata]|uniref:Uncharacterized protein n=1 Tax=Kipferlia bialata TaxID=797122 RepID=A0A391NZJ9_9EUKA|nr:hypothetical protein KIPB_000208 [Kipferlia bialata]|eukprot:g208.t1